MPKNKKFALNNRELGFPDSGILGQSPDLDLSQISGSSRMTASVPEYSSISSLLNTFQFNSNASSILSLPFLALPPMNFPDFRRNAKCAICDEVATGRHYGAATCFGCKSFWRRSIYFQRKYRCKFDGKCELKKAPHQNLCRACRLRKCFEVGMNPEGW
uniref:Nuclear receptor domain-containing protein n=1 Tax=Panagrolaimus davidi TaxID=227884 RepID=A0A914Q6C6_9BILA